MNLHRITLLAIVTTIFMTATAFAVNVVVEAESYYKIKPSMKPGEHSKASQKKCITIPLRRPHGKNQSGPSDDGNAAYKIKVPRTGRYQLWGRCWWYDACGNSFFILVDKKKVTSKTPYITDQTFRKWHWVAGPAMRLKKGEHIIRFQNREDGSNLDQWLLTTRPKQRWVPVRIQNETDKYILEKASDKDKNGDE